MSKLLDPDLFAAVHRAVTTALLGDRAPNRLIDPGTTLLRAVETRFLLDGDGHFDPSKVPLNLLVRDARSDKNRFTGVAPRRGRLGSHVRPAGGVYFSRHAAAMLNEVRHYAGGGAAAKALHAKSVIHYRVLHPLLLLDLSAESDFARDFLAELETDRDVAAALAANPGGGTGKTLHSHLLDPLDYSVARAVGLAVGHDRRFDGLQTQTARASDRSGETGDNVLLIGGHARPVTAKLFAEQVTLIRDHGPHRAGAQGLRMDQHDLRTGAVRRR